MTEMNPSCAARADSASDNIHSNGGKTAAVAGRFAHLVSRISSDSGRFKPRRLPAVCRTPRGFVRAGFTQGGPIIVRHSLADEQRVAGVSSLAAAVSPAFSAQPWPSARPFGPISICHGIPIRSAVANLAPGRSSRS